CRAARSAARRGWGGRGGAIRRSSATSLSVARVGLTLRVRVGLPHGRTAPREGEAFPHAEREAYTGAGRSRMSRIALWLSRPIAPAGPRDHNDKRPPIPSPAAFRHANCI